MEHSWLAKVTDYTRILLTLDTVCSVENYLDNYHDESFIIYYLI